MKTIYIRPSPADTRFIMYWLVGSTIATFITCTVSNEHESLIDEDCDTEIFGSRPFIYGVTSDEELSAWASEIKGRLLKVVTDKDKYLYFSLGGKYGYVGVSRHNTIAYVNVLDGGYHLFEVSAEQRQEIEESGIVFEEYLIATVASYGGIVE